MIQKQDIFVRCEQITLNRIEEIKKAIDAASDSIINDTKSSMGDKYETSREMGQQELNRLQIQLNQAQKDLDLLLGITDLTNKVVGLGSLVVTTGFIYFIAISVGIVKIGDVSIMVISKQSPIGSLLFGKSVGDKLEFNSNTFTIKEII